VLTQVAPAPFSSFKTLSLLFYENRQTAFLDSLVNALNAENSPELKIVQLMNLFLINLKHCYSGFSGPKTIFFLMNAV